MRLSIARCAQWLCEHHVARNAHFESTLDTRGQSENRSGIVLTDEVGGFLVRSGRVSGHDAGPMREFCTALAEAHPELQLAVVQSVAKSQGNGHGKWPWQTQGVVEVRCTNRLPDLACSLAELLSQLEMQGKRFQYCESVVPMQRLCESTLGAVVSTAADLAKPMLGALETTFAVKIDGLRGLDGQSRTVWVEEIANAVNATRVHKVDLEKPAVIVHIQIFAGPNGHRAGVCIRHGALRLACPSTQIKHHKNAGMGWSFYVEGINNGLHASQLTDEIGDILPLESVVALSVRIQPLLEAAIARAERSVCNAAALDTKLEPLKCDHLTDSRAAESRLGRSRSSSRRPCIRKALGSTQVSALVSQAAEAGLLQKGVWFVEFGAGRGSLTDGFREAMTSTGLAPAGYVLIDRDRVKDGIPGQSSKSFWVEQGHMRLKVDIENLSLSGIAGLGNGGQQVVGIGKHVCGSATDLTLRCLVNDDVPGGSLETWDASDISEEEAKSIFMSYTSAERSHVGHRVGQSLFSTMTCRQRLLEMRKLKGTPPRACGVAVALCCHHCCCWKHYINPRYVEEAGLTPIDFSTVCRASSWAVSAAEGSQRELFGTVCKRFLDVGRAAFLATHGFRVSLRPYVDRSVTKENMMLLAVRH